MRGSDPWRGNHCLGKLRTAQAFSAAHGLFPQQSARYTVPNSELEGEGHPPPLPEHRGMASWT